MVKYARETPARVRLQKRSPDDIRMKDSSLYVEVHHIIPKSLGGIDNPDNLVEVLPEEHIFLHMLRYKIYQKREDMLAVRFMLNSFDSRHVYRGMKIILTKKIRMGYAWLRSHAQLLRQTEGWHTEEGIKNISKARKGMMPVRDVETGKIVGAASINHPNVLSGKWVHHSKGRKLPKEEIEYKRKISLGQNNPNASGLSEEYFIEKGIEAYREFGIILSWTRMLTLSQIRGFPWIQTVRSRFGGKGYNEYYSILEKRLGIKFDRYKSKYLQLC